MNIPGTTDRVWEGRNITSFSSEALVYMALEITFYTYSGKKTLENRDCNNRQEIEKVFVGKQSFSGKLGCDGR